MRLISLIAAAAIFAAAPNMVFAHSKVVSSTPAAEATVARPRVVSMTFSEALIPPTAAASIVMTAMPGVKAHGEMVIRNFTIAWSNNNRTMTLELKQPLKTGTYEARWQAAGADGHRMTGKVNFKVS